MSQTTGRRRWNSKFKNWLGCRRMKQRNERGDWFLCEQQLWLVGSHLCSVVLGGADEHSQVHWGLDVVDVPGVLLGFLQDLPRLPISETYTHHVTYSRKPFQPLRLQRGVSPWRWSGWSLRSRVRRSQTPPEGPTRHWWSCDRWRVTSGRVGCPLPDSKGKIKLVSINFWRVNGEKIFCLFLINIEERTDLLRVSQVKEVKEALVAHLLVCGEHDDVAAEVEAARSDSGVGVEQRQLFPCTATTTTTTTQLRLTTRKTPNVWHSFTSSVIHPPVSQSHSRQLLSAEPVKTFFVSPEGVR